MPDDVEMGDSPPQIATTNRRAGGPCATALPSHHVIKKPGPRTPTPAPGPSACSSPDELATTSTQNPAGPSKAGKAKPGPPGPVSKPTRGVKSSTTVRAPAKTGMQEKTPAPVAKAATRAVTPAIPINLLDKTNKRPKRPITDIQSPEHAATQPQKPTSSASKADEQQWLRRVKGYIEMAHAITPAYAKILRAVDAAIKGETYQTLEARTEKLLARLENLSD